MHHRASKLHFDSIAASPRDRSAHSGVLPTTVLWAVADNARSDDQLSLLERGTDPSIKLVSTTERIVTPSCYLFV